MGQYFNLVFKNYSTSFSQDSNENLLDEHGDTLDSSDSNLHYNIPFWIGAIAIAVLFLSAIIATIRYCFYTLCSSHSEIEKIALMSPRSPCSSSNSSNRTQRHKCQLADSIPHSSSDDNETSLSSIEQSRDDQSNVSVIPIHRHYRRSYLTSSPHNVVDNDAPHGNNDYFSPIQALPSQGSIDFRKRTHGIYVLPVSPALSSTSSTSSSANRDETIKKVGWKTMPNRSRTHLTSSSSPNNHHESLRRGFQNSCFTDSPQPKDRTVRYIQPPSQPPPLPPTVSNRDIAEKSFMQCLSTKAVDLSLNAINLHFDSTSTHQVNKGPPPPVPCRARKPSQLPISLDEFMNQPELNNIGPAIESSPQDDASERSWPKPPDSMTTSEISRPSSISYDHLHPTIIIHQNSTAKSFQQYKPNEHSILTESDT